MNSSSDSSEPIGNATSSAFGSPPAGSSNQGVSLGDSQPPEPAAGSKDVEAPTGETPPAPPTAQDAPGGKPAESNSDLESPRTPSSGRTQPVLKVVAVGNAGVNILEELLQGGRSGLEAAAINTDAASLAASSASQKEQFETQPLRGLGTGGDPERGRELAEEHSSRLKSLCDGADVVLLVTGLGGGAGTGISPVLARAAKENGALVLAFVTLPFDCEGNRRQAFARQALSELREIADGVVCLPSQKVLKLVDESTSVVDTFRRADRLLADAVRGIARLLTRRGLLEIHFSELAALLRGGHTQSCFAVAEAFGPTRWREVLERLLAHPMLDAGEALAQADAVLVSLVGGPDLTMSEVNLLMNELQKQCGHAQVLMGAAIDEAFRERLAVTLIAARRVAERETDRGSVYPSSHAESLENQILRDSPTSRPASRFVPPAPQVSREKLEQFMVGQGGSRARKNLSKLRQTQLPLDIISKGRFDKSEPTIHKGEDLDVPTYIRRGISLN